MYTYEAFLYHDDECIAFLLYDADAMPARMVREILHILRSVQHAAGNFSEAVISRNGQHIGCIREGKYIRQYLIHNHAGLIDEYITYCIVEK